MNSIPQRASNQSDREFPAFHTLSSEYFGTEMGRNQATEFLFFTLLGLMTAWPIISMIAAAGRMVRSY
jgi:hypothetical protein